MDDRADLGDANARRQGVPDTALIVATRVAAGAAIMAIASVAALVNRRGDGDGDGGGGGDGDGGGGNDGGGSDGDNEEPSEDVDRTVRSRVAAALLAGLIGAERRAADAVQEARTRIQPVVDSARGNPLLRPIERLLSSGDDLVDRGRGDAGEGVDQVLQAWDTVLDHLVRDALRHVDVNELARSVDVDAIVARVDVQGIVERVDLDAVVGRVDIDAIVRRLDIADLARRFLEEIDIAQVIRESSGSLADETVDIVRQRGADADDRVAGFVDRILRRTDARDTRVVGRSPGQGGGEAS
jgi:hypothetical protein